MEVDMNNDLNERLSPEARLRRMGELEEALMAAMAFIDQYVDVEDGPDGIPAPNYAMALNTFLNEVLEGKDD
jgi:hypothetical protein